MSVELSTFTLDKYLFGRQHIHQIINHPYFSNNFPIVYILYDARKKIGYVGESTNGLSRILNHLGNQTKNHLTNIYIIASPSFNKSATLDIESNLIKYISADGHFSLLNANAGIVEHNYFQRKFYFELFEKIWDKLALEKVVLKNILAIDNSDLFKYSPYKSLSQDQKLAVREYLNILLGNDQSTTFIKGSAGTGKTIVAVYLMKLLLTKIDLDDYEDKEADDMIELNLAQKVQEKFMNMKIALVVPMSSLRKTLQTVFANVRGLSRSMVISPTEVSKSEYDIVLVDESHRLKQRKNLVGYAAFDQANARLGLERTGTELDWLLKQSSHQLFFYDAKQSVRPSDIPEEVFSELRSRKNTHLLQLNSQLRVQGGLDYVKFIHALLHHELSEENIPTGDANYDLRLYNSLGDLVRDLGEKENEFQLCRLVAGYAWPWVSKKINKPDTVIDGVELYWNRVSTDWINSPNAMHEMGCIHTTQGYDLNYAGVIFGNEIKYDKKLKRIFVDRDNYYDANGRNGITDPQELHDYIINIYTTLMFRGIKGTYVYVCDNNLREYLALHIKEY